MGSLGNDIQRVKTFTKKENESDVSLQAMLLCRDQINAAVLNAAIDLNLFDIIAQATPNADFVSPSEIASKFPTQNANTPHRLDRFLRLLVSFSLLTCSTRTNQDGSIERLYGLSRVGKYFLSKDGGPSWASLVPKFSYHPYMAEIWLNFKEAILDGGDDLCKIVHGKPLYQYLEADSSLKHVFNRAMADLSALHKKKILETYDGFEGISTLVEVAGGIGQSLKMIISKYPSIKGSNFDLPHMTQDAPTFPGIRHIGGDMFKSVAESDAIMIKGTTHNWSDKKCIKLFSNCHQALKKGGKVVVIDLIMPEEPELSSAAKCVSIFDNVMFSQGGGLERTEKEFESLSKASGFSRFRVACRVLFILGVMEFYR